MTKCAWAAVALLIAFAAEARAQGTPNWQRYSDPDGAISLDVPSGIFSRDAGPADRGSGRKLTSADGRSKISFFSMPNDKRETAASYLRDRLLIDPATIVYRRLGQGYFVVSSYRGENIFYTRCNFGARIRCVYLEYPRELKRPFDPVVTRISRSLV